MHNAMPVRVIQRFGELREEAVNLAQRKRTRFHFCFERPRFEVAHHEIGDAVAFAEIEDGQDVRMFEPRDDTRLLLEARRKLGTLRQLARQDFDRHVPIHGRLVRLVDGRHASFADLTDNSVGAKHLPRLKSVHIHS